MNLSGVCEENLCAKRRRVQLQPADVVFKYVGTPVLVGQAHPHNLIGTPWAAKGHIDVLGAIGGGEHEDLTARFDAIEQDQELGDGGDLVLGTLGRARWPARSPPSESGGEGGDWLN